MVSLPAEICIEFFQKELSQFWKTEYEPMLLLLGESNEKYDEDFNRRLITIIGELGLVWPKHAFSITKEIANSLTYFYIHATRE